MLRVCVRRFGLLSIAIFFLLLAGGQASGSLGVSVRAAGVSANPHIAASLAWQQLPNGGPTPRQYAAMASDGANLVLFGGCCTTGGGFLGDTWIFNGSSWQTVGGTGPSAREHASMAYDAANQDFVLFGGCCDSFGNSLADTWTFSIATQKWSQQSPAASPPARSGASLSYDGTQLVLFGGCCGTGGALSDTWTWNGSTWTQQNGSGPPARTQGSMAYDGAHAVLFGGQSGDTLLGDTWSWNGSAWSAVCGTTAPPTSPCGPAARDLAALATGPAGNGLVLFGGCCNGSANLSDTWSWSGSTWTQLTPAPSPSAREGASMALDATTGRDVLVNGCCDSTGNALGDAWVLGVPPAVSSLSPASGPSAGGTAVTITGSGFSTAPGGTKISFGTAASSNVTCSSATQCTATSPFGAGVVDVRVTVAGLTSPVGVADQFDYMGAPVSLSCAASGSQTVGVGGSTETCSVTLTSALNPGNAVEVTNTTPAVQTVTSTDTACAVGAPGCNPPLGISTGTTIGTGLAGPATQFAIVDPPSVISQPASLVITALDANGNVATSYTGTIALTTSDSAATLPPGGSTCPGSANPLNQTCSAYTFTAGDNGVLSFSDQVTFHTQGTQTVSATDTSSATITGHTQATVNATPVGAATHLGVVAQTAAIAGSPISVIVSALDADNNVVPTYAGSVTLTSTDSAAVLPGSAYAFTAGDAGIHAFSVTLNTASSSGQTVSASDGTLSGRSNAIGVGSSSGSCGSQLSLCRMKVTVPGDASQCTSPTSPATCFVPGAVNAGSAFPFVVSVTDQSNRPETDFHGLVSFSTIDSDPNVSLPNPYAFVSGDKGAHLFDAILQTPGTRNITAQDQQDNFGATPAAVGVHAASGPTKTFLVSAQPSSNVGVPVTVFVSALDSHSNLVTGYTGTIQLTTTDVATALPFPGEPCPGTVTAANGPCYTFTAADHGQHAFTVTFATAYEQQIQTSGGNPTGCTSGTGITATGLMVGPGTPPYNSCSYANSSANVLPAGTVIGTEVLVNGNSPVPLNATALSAICNSATPPPSPTLTQCGSGAAQLIPSVSTAVTGPGAEILSVPQVIRFDTSFSPVAGGITITIYGTAFDSGGAVPSIFPDSITFNGTPAAKIFNCSNTQCTVQVPASPLATPGDGLVDVRVTTAAGESPVTLADKFSYAPVVTSIIPQEGPAGSPTPVTITGTGFDTTSGNTTVHFVPLAGTPSAGNAATAVSCSSQTTCTASSPTSIGSGTTADLQVTVAAQTSAANVNDHYTFTSQTPAAATCNGEGQNEALIPGGAAGCTIVLDSTLQGGESLQVTLTAPSGFSNLLCSAASGFKSPVVSGTVGGGGTVNTCAFVNSSSSTAIPAGTTAGQMLFTVPTSATTASTVGFTAATCYSGGSAVTDFGSMQCGSSCNSTPCTNYQNYPWTTPPNPPNPPPAPNCGTTTEPVVTFTNPNQDVCAQPIPVAGGGTAFVPAPTVQAVGPTSAVPGAKIIVQGVGFAPAQGVSTTVIFGASTSVTPAPGGIHCDNSDSCQVQVVVPPQGGNPATVDVTVKVGSVTSQTNGNDKFTFQAPPNAPTVTNVSPNSGPAAGGTSVTVSGTNFGPVGTQINFKFGPYSVPGSSCTPLNAPTSCTATAPPGAGSVDVQAQVTLNGVAYTSAVNAPADQFTYNAATTTTGWKPLSVTGPDARSGAATASSGQQVVLFGGCTAFDGSGNCTNTLGDTWTWNGSAWALEAAPGASPPARWGATMAPGSAQNSVVLFGGVDAHGAVLNDTWVWTKGSWTQAGSVTETSSPPARSAASMAYDAATQTVILFGGIASNGGSLGDTWAWDGRVWTAICGTPSASACSIAARSHASMTFDYATAKILLFGGRFTPTDPMSAQIDTWSFDGTSWSFLPATIPLPRSDAVLAYDQANEQTVLFGGTDQNGNALADTWLWDGTAWTAYCGANSKPACAPAARSAAGLAYVYGGLTLFGGANGTTMLGDTATWGPATSPTVTAVSPSTAAQGTAITISGTGFSTAPGATAISFGTVAVPAANITCSSTISCVATSPAPSGGAGIPVDVTVAVEGRTSATNPNDLFTYTGPPPSNAVAANPTSVPATGTSTSTITVTLVDANNSPLANRTITLAQALQGGGASNSTIAPEGSPSAHIAATPNTAVTNSSGVARFLVSDGTVETVVYTATDTTDSATVGTATVKFVPEVSSTLSTVTADTTSVQADGSSVAHITVTLIDVNSNPVSGKVVTLAKSGGSAQINGSPSAATAADGKAVFTVSDGTVETLTFTATDATDNIVFNNANQTVQISFTAPSGPSASTSTVVENFPAVADDGNYVATVTVTLLIPGNPPTPVSNRTVKLTQTSSSQTVSATNTAKTDSNGQAMFTLADRTPETVTYSVADTTDNVTLSTPATVTFEPQGDVNLDGSVSSIDALCVLRYVAGLGSTTACAKNAATLDAADVNRDGSMSSLDALCVLRLVAHLGTTGACPIFPPSIANHGPVASAARATTAASIVSKAATAQVKLSSSQVDGRSGRQTTVKLTTTATGSGLAAWTVDIAYDPSQVQVATCDAGGAAVCNPAYAPGTLRLSGASTAGLGGSQTLATITFTGKGHDKAVSLTLDPQTLVDPDGASLLPAPSTQPGPAEAPR